jgi:ATP-binding cassette subfamily C protein
VTAVIADTPRTFVVSAQEFLRDFAHIAGKNGAFALTSILAGAVLEGIGISLLVPLLGLLFSGGGAPRWLASGTAMAFALFGARGQFQRLLVLLGIFGALVVLRAIVISIRDIMIIRLQLEFAKTQQLRTAEALAAAPWECLASFRHARITQLMGADMQRLGVGIHFVLRGATAAIIFLVQCVLAFLLAPLLAGALALMLIAGMIAFGPLLANSRSLGDYVADANLALLDTSTQFMGGLKLAISHDLQSGFVSVIRQTLQSLADRQLRFARQHVLGQSGLITLFGLLGAMIVFCGVFWFHVAPPLLIALLVLVSRMTAPIGQIHQAAEQFVHLLAVSDKMQQLQRELACASRGDGKNADAPFPEGDITFENVSFIRTSSVDVPANTETGGLIRDLNMTIGHGEFLVITGDSGTGKTTLLDLLAGLYRPTSGRIVVGARTLDSTTFAAWRRGLAYVPQDPFLFHDTIRRNLSWANPRADEMQMWNVLGMTGADGLVRRMEHGLDTVVGERGTLVSGGERQRIALARALLRSPRLLILDEATSALDSESERRILVELRSMIFRPTIVLVAHRTENLAICDRVVRFEREGIVQGISRYAVS